MQILYVVGIMVLSVLTLESVVTSEGMKTNTSATYRSQSENLKLTWQLSRATRLAYETSLKNSGTCPAGTRSYSPPGTPNVVLCWGAEMQADCFRNVLSPTGRQVCLRGNQLSLHSLFVPKAYASGSHHVHYAEYHGLANPNPNPTPIGGGPQNGALVRLPPPNSTAPNAPIRSNHVNCGTSYTECFSVVYCLNGTTNCNNANMVVQTFATRWFE